MSLRNSSVDNLLLPFNKTRVPGSEGSKEVQDFILDQFRSMKQDWSVETHSFQENGYNFTNLIFSQGGNESYLALAAHYDSKLTPDGFIGGIDSAAPCAMLLYISHFIDHVLTEDDYLMEPLLLANYTGIKIIFFDGEEAFKEWSDTDSLYGSRYAANKWSEDGQLNEMELFVLLDLLGGYEDVLIPNYNRGVRPYFKTLQLLERKYNRLYNATHRMFKNSNPLNAQISDDQEPFVERGINALHLIPYPFPSQWHTMDDDFQHLDEHNIQKWCILICEFVLKYWTPNDKI